MQSTVMIFKLALLLMLTACSSVSLSTAQQTGGAVSEFTPSVYSIESSAECDQYNPLHDQELMKKLTETVAKLPRTCVSIHSGNPSAPSGYYNITTNGSSILVYCDMEGTNCGGEGGWMRVAYVNMTQPGATCPQGLEQKSSTSYTLCGLNINHGCNSTMFSTPVEYSKVCGQVRGYQYSPPLAFYAYNANTSLTIDDVYIDGVSITYGNAPRKHIWTYAGGPYDISDKFNYNCPCKQNSTGITPPYVGTDYYCESGVNICCSWNMVATSDPLWDGQQCGGGEAPCCTHPNMPWFIKTLNETTTEDIELRLCKIGMYGSTITGDTPLDLIELFVK